MVGQRAVRSRVIGACASVLMATALLPGRADAFDAQEFAPAVDPQGYFSVYSSKTAPKGRFYVGMVYDYAKDSLRIRQDPDRASRLPGLLGPLLDPLAGPVAEDLDDVVDGNNTLDQLADPLFCALAPITDTLVAPVLDDFLDACARAGSGGRSTVVDELHQGDLVASYSVLDFLEIGVNIPFSYVKSDVEGVNEGVDIDDVRFNAKVQVLDPDRFGLGLAIVPFVDVPTGDEGHLTSNHEVDFGGIGVAEFVTRKVRFALNGGYRANHKPFDDDDEIDQFLFGGAVGFLLIGEQPILGADQHRLELIGEAFGSTAEDEPFEEEYETPAEWLAGLKYYHPSGMLASVGGGRRITDSINGPDLRVVAQLGYTWQPKPPPPPAPPPPPPPPPPQPKVVVTDEQIVTLEPIYFDFDKSTIKPVSYPILDQVAKVMSERPGVTVRVEGHTDSVGTDAYNQKLSERRAHAVVRYLIGKGIDTARLQAIGFGEARPIATNDTAEGRARNRRTEFHIINK